MNLKHLFQDALSGLALIAFLGAFGFILAIFH